MVDNTIKAKIQSHLNQNIIKLEPLAGGCIADSYKLKTELGDYFLKTSTNKEYNFLKEAHGLNEIKKTGTIKTPEVVHCDKNFLLLEFIEQGQAKKNTMFNFGKNLARLHQNQIDYFGYFEDNLIGNNPQKNTPQLSFDIKNSWEDFFFNNRLLFQIEISRKKNILTNELEDAIWMLKDPFFELFSMAQEKPCLIHGDLWSGNFIIDKYGEAFLIDPAVYYAHREAEFGMIKLFGGFDSDFYNGYNKTYELKQGVEKREGIYKLYHVLNHFNLFGESYYHQALTLISSYLN